MKTENEIKILTQLGLTLNQARVYLALVKRGFVGAKEISQSSKIAKQDIYRVMPTLQKLGLVERLLASPNLFKAISPINAISVLLQHKEKENSVLHEKALRLIEVLNQKTENITTEEDTVQFSIITGRNTILTRSKKAIAEAKESICLLSPWRANFKNAFHFLSLSKQALDKQVKLSFILYVEERDFDVFLKTKHYFREDPRFKVKLLLTGESISFSVFDRAQVFFSIQNGFLGSVPILWSNNSNFARLAQNHFDILWKTALTPESIIKSKYKTAY